MKKLIVLFLILIFSACSSESETRERVKKVFVEELILREKYKDNRKEYDAQLENLYKKYSFSEQEYRQEIYTMSQDYFIWERFFDDAATYMTELREKEQKKEQKQQAEREKEIRFRQ